jgi:hypothetical protein
LPASKAVTYSGFMARRLGAIVFLVMGAYVGSIGITIGASILRSLFAGPWLGWEPEILIAIGICLVAALLLWVGIKLWRQDER